MNAYEQMDLESLELAITRMETQLAEAKKVYLKKLAEVETKRREAMEARRKSAG